MALATGSKVFLGVIVLVAGLVVGGLAYANHLLGGEPGEGEPVVIEVPAGATAASIGDFLADRGVVRSSLAFRLVARSRGFDARLLAGTYDLATGMSVDEAIDTLLGGPRQPEAIRFTVQEGLTVEQTLQRLAAQTEYRVEEFRRVLDQGQLDLPDWVPDLGSFGPEVREPYEGLLFPETYEMRAEATAAAILQRMVNQLARVYDSIPPEQVETAQAKGLDRYQALVAASLVERETRVGDERPTVAGVLYNRLDRDMPLQIDATVLYALGQHRDRVLFEDLDVESPYNTYRVQGLPPTPISGSGAASIRAVFDPEEVTFLYYVLHEDCSGRHAFANTLDEHNRNVARFRQSDCAP